MHFSLQGDEEESDSESSIDGDKEEDKDEEKDTESNHAEQNNNQSEKVEKRLTEAFDEDNTSDEEVHCKICFTVSNKNEKLHTLYLIDRQKQNCYSKSVTQDLSKLLQLRHIIQSFMLYV